MSISRRALNLLFGPGLVLAVAAAPLTGCGGGAYGFSRTYQPLASEQRHFAEAKQLTYQDLVREPNAYRSTEIGWFGVVTELYDLRDGRTRISLTLRSHQARHLCSDESKSSCRVTISEGGLGIFSADVRLNADDLDGQERVWHGSLLKIYGKPTGQYSEETGPVLEVTYYRHWPRGYYVTTAQRGAMRR